MKLETVFYVAIIVILIIILILQFLELPKSGQSEGYAPGLRRAFQRHNLNYDNPILTTEQNSRYRKEMKINPRYESANTRNELPSSLHTSNEIYNPYSSDAKRMKSRDASNNTYGIFNEEITDRSQIPQSQIPQEVKEDVHANGISEGILFDTKNFIPDSEAAVKPQTYDEIPDVTIATNVSEQFIKNPRSSPVFLSNTPSGAFRTKNVKSQRSSTGQNRGLSEAGKLN